MPVGAHEAQQDRVCLPTLKRVDSIDPRPGQAEGLAALILAEETPEQLHLFVVRGDHTDLIGGEPSTHEELGVVDLSLTACDYVAISI